MSTDAKVAIVIFAMAMIATIGLGIASMRGRDADLSEWSVGGRSFGVVLTGVLLFNVARGPSFQRSPGSLTPSSSQV